MTDHNAVGAGRFSMPTRRQVSRNIVTNVAQKILLGFSGLVVTGLLARLYSLETLGVWTLTIGLLAFVSFADLGIPSALPRLIPAMQADPRRGDPQEAVAASLIVAGGMAAALLLACVPASAWLPGAYGLNGGAARQAEILFTGVLALGAVLLPLRVGTGILSALHRYSDVYASEMVGSVAKLAGVATLGLLFAFDFVYVGIFIVAVGLVPPTIQAVKGLRRIAPRMPSRGTLRNLWREMLSLSIASVLISAGTAALLHGPAVAANQIDGTAAAALIGLPVVMSSSLLAVLRSSAGFMTPVASGLSAMRDGVGVYRVFVTNTLWVTALTGGAACAMIVVGPLVMHLWLDGGDLPPGSVDVMATNLQIVMMATALSTPGLTARIVLSASGRHWTAGIVELVGAVGALGVGTVMMLTTDWGTTAMATGIAVGYLLRGAIIMPALIARHMGVSYRTLMIDAWLRPTALIAANALLATALVRFLPIGGLVGNLVSAIVVLTVWAIACVFFIAREDERVGIARAAARLLPARTGGERRTDG